MRGGIEHRPAWLGRYVGSSRSIRGSTSQNTFGEDEASVADGGIPGMSTVAPFLSGGHA